VNFLSTQRHAHQLQHDGTDKDNHFQLEPHSFLPLLRSS
jgi:hypothetical protein